MGNIKAEEAMRELTLMLLYLSRFTQREKFHEATDFYAWKGYDFDILNELDDADYIRQGNHPSRSKSVYITESGMERQKSFYPNMVSVIGNRGEKMKNLFERTSSNWVRYSEYEWKAAEDGTLYLTPTKTAQPSIYDPLAEYQKIVLDAINIGRMGMSKKPDAEIQKAIQQFAVKYGLFGLMTALPTTPNFMEYEAVYLPKNHFIKKETMSTEKYLALFFPFDKLDVIKRGIESMWNIQNDRVMMALALTMTDKPMAVNMSFQREYAERYEWIKQQFIDWAFTYINSFLYYEDYDTLNDETRQMMQQSMAAFGGIAPTYHIALLDKPTIIWDFHSLMLGVQMMFSFMLTDSENPIKLCRHCTKAFVASRPSAVFCSPQCKNKHNVYKSRARNKSEE